jgi:acetyl esterase
MRAHEANDRGVAALRRAAGALLTDNVFLGMASVSKLHPWSRPERHGVEVLRDISYGREPWMKLDVWRPVDRPANGAPALLYIHGGGFRILSKDTHWVMGLAFARAGYTVFNVNYRLAPRDPFPAAVEDVSEAFRWVVDRGRSFGADASKLVIAGESAGANLTLALTLAATHEHGSPLARRVYDTGVVPRASAPMCGLHQVSDTQRFRRKKPGMNAFIFDRIHEVELCYLGPSRVGASDPARDLADPLVWLERGAPTRPLPPLFTAVGTKDPLVDDTRRLARAWAERGGAVHAHVAPGEVHAYHAFVWRKAARETWRKKLEFLGEALGAER